MNTGASEGRIGLFMIVIMMKFTTAFRTDSYRNVLHATSVVISSLIQFLAPALRIPKASNIGTEHFVGQAMRSCLVDFGLRQPHKIQISMCISMACRHPDDCCTQKGLRL